MTGGGWPVVSGRKWCGGVSGGDTGASPTAVSGVCSATRLGAQHRGQRVCQARGRQVGQQRGGCSQRVAQGGQQGLIQRRLGTGRRQGSGVSVHRRSSAAQDRSVSRRVGTVARSAAPATRLPPGVAGHQGLSRHGTRVTASACFPRFCGGHNVLTCQAAPPPHARAPRVWQHVVREAQRRRSRVDQPEGWGADAANREGRAHGPACP